MKDKNMFFSRVKIVPDCSPGYDQGSVILYLHILSSPTQSKGGVNPQIPT